MIWPLSAIGEGRLKRARVAAAGARVEPDELRRRLRALGQDDAPIAVTDAEGSTIVAAWQLVGIPWATLLFRKKLRTTWALHLRILEGTVRAEARQGKVQWETIAATWMPRATVRWSRPSFPDFGPSAASGQAPVTADTPRDLPGLVAPVRRCVVEAGFAWEPTLKA